jgi:hypothetical protein
MKQTLSWILYSTNVTTNETYPILDSLLLRGYDSRTILRYGYGYGLYKTLMLWSVDLDDKFNVWKEVKPSGRGKK